MVTITHATLWFISTHGIGSEDSFLLMDTSSSLVQYRLLCPDILSIFPNSRQKIENQKTGVFPKSSGFQKEYLWFRFQDEKSVLFIDNEIQSTSHRKTRFRSKIHTYLPLVAKVWHTRWWLGVNCCHWGLNSIITLSWGVGGTISCLTIQPLTSQNLPRLRICSIVNTYIHTYTYISSCICFIAALLNNFWAKWNTLLYFLTAQYSNLKNPNTNVTYFAALIDSSSATCWHLYIFPCETTSYEAQIQKRTHWPCRAMNPMSKATTLQWPQDRGSLGKGRSWEICAVFGAAAAKKVNKDLGPYRFGLHFEQLWETILSAGFFRT